MQNEQLNSLLSVVSAIEKSTERLQETLASLDGAKVNAQETVHRLMSLYTKTETLVEECESALKEMSKVQEEAKQFRAMFSDETMKLSQKCNKLDDYVHVSVKRRDEMQKDLEICMYSI